MSKIIIISSTIFILIIISLFLFLPNNDSDNKTTGYSIWTKAICNATYCQDYEITCENDQMIGMEAITGAVMEISDDWSDPRTPKQINQLCG